MKLAYEAQNSIEAHMILNLLEQAGLSARIDGEYLQGGVGELQAIGLVRVMVKDADYYAAKEIIDEWDTRQPIMERPSSHSKNSATFITGLVLGMLITILFFTLF